MNIGSPRLRRNLGIGAVAIVVATWLAVVAIIFPLPFDRTRFVVMWTTAVLMTEALFWIAVAIGGITALNRFRLWRSKPAAGQSRNLGATQSIEKQHATLPHRVVFRLAQIADGDAPIAGAREASSKICDHHSARMDVWRPNPRYGPVFPFVLRRTKYVDVCAT